MEQSHMEQSHMEQQQPYNHRQPDNSSQQVSRNNHMAITHSGKLYNPICLLFWGEMFCVCFLLFWVLGAARRRFQNKTEQIFVTCNLIFAEIICCGVEGCNRKNKMYWSGSVLSRFLRNIVYFFLFWMLSEGRRRCSKESRADLCYLAPFACTHFFLGSLFGLKVVTEYRKCSDQLQYP